MVAKLYQEFLRESTLAPFDIRKRIGNWKSIFVRSNSKDEIMAAINLDPQNLTDTEIENLIESLGNFFQQGPGMVTNLSSLYLNVSAHSDEIHENQRLIFGLPFLEQEFHGFNFNLGPGSFFQSNLPCLELVFEQVSKNLRMKPHKTILLDMCCGVGFYRDIQNSYLVDSSLILFVQSIFNL